MINANIASSDDMGKFASSPETIVIINCVLNVPLMITSIVGNTVVLAAILRTSSLRSPSMILLCSLALSDILIGFLVQPLWISHELTKIRSLNDVVSAMAFAACGVSLSTMTAISVDRFLALHYHMRYPSLMTTHRAFHITGSLWLISFLLSLLNIWRSGANHFAMVTAFGIIVCLLVSTICYIQIYQIVRRHQLQIQAQQQAVENFNAENNQSMQRSIKSALNTFIYYLVMILCYTPVFVTTSLIANPRHRWTSAWNFADTVAFMNSSINPFLYCWRMRELRAAVVKTAKQIIYKETEEN